MKLALAFLGQFFVQFIQSWKRKEFINLFVDIDLSLLKKRLPQNYTVHLWLKICALPPIVTFSNKDLHLFPKWETAESAREPVNQ